MFLLAVGLITDFKCVLGKACLIVPLMKVKWKDEKMAKKVKLFVKNNQYFVIIGFILTIVLVVFSYLIMGKIIRLKGYDLYNYYILSVLIILMLSSFLYFCKYEEWRKYMFLRDMETINSIDLIKKYKIKKPLIKKMDAFGFSKDKTTLSGFLIIMEFICEMNLMIQISMSLNLWSRIVGCFIVYITFGFRIILEFSNDFYEETVELLSEKTNEDLVITEDFNVIIKENKVKISIFLCMIIILSVLNLVIPIII